MPVSGSLLLDLASLIDQGLPLDQQTLSLVALAALAEADDDSASWGIILILFIIMGVAVVRRYRPVD